MIIVCTKQEKEKLIEILSDKDTACVFNPLECAQNEYCNICLEQNINWFIEEKGLSNDN